MGSEVNHLKSKGHCPRSILLHIPQIHSKRGLGSHRIHNLQQQAGTLGRMQQDHLAANVDVIVDDTHALAAAILLLLYQSGTLMAQSLREECDDDADGIYQL